MSINAFTLNNLYNNGILDYVPYELTSGMVGTNLQPLSNPYRTIVAQYNGTDSFIPQYNENSTNQNYINSGDTFIRNTMGPNNYINQNISGGINAFDGGIGFNSSAGLNGFDGGIGLKSNIDSNSLNNLGFNSQGGMNAFDRGAGNLGNSFSQGVSNFVNNVNRTPSFVKGLISGTILLGGLLLCFKTKKKPITPKTNNSFLSKINPLKIFKKK